MIVSKREAKSRDSDNLWIRPMQSEWVVLVTSIKIKCPQGKKERDSV